ncbi:Histone-lysine N-methyltransferase SETMAR [Habropoda laboriosa]|uniref:Histone-lysine N-methyltransferase SETMAR n=1 Tax=Habropoda laboriosa TaxID=597456 RepID=A0A0L7RG89_9HYME|nr:Histone-lysine N-methyltransferase SETMAR [Habropoda laboriosa]
MKRLIQTCKIREAIAVKHSGLLNQNEVIFHYDNVKPHVDTFQNLKHIQIWVNYSPYFFEVKLSLIRPALVNRKGSILLHDNARPHVSLITVQKLNDLEYETLQHPPYSPDFSPTDYHLFKHFNHFIKKKA